MAESFKIVENPEKPLSMHPKKFALWLFLVTIVMIFASLTSAYLVKKGDGNWRTVDLPSLFWVTSGIIVVSSAVLHIAYRAAKKDLIENVKWGLLITLVLGIAFTVGQFYSWGQLIDNNIYLVGGNPSESFVYLLSGFHLLHVVGGLIFGIVVTVNAFKYKVHSKSTTQIEMFATYWHFVGALWIYLFVFLMLNHQ